MGKTKLPDSPGNTNIQRGFSLHLCVTIRSRATRWSRGEVKVMKTGPREYNFENNAQTSKTHHGAGFRTEEQCTENKMSKTEPVMIPFLLFCVTAWLAGCHPIL